MTQYLRHFVLLTQISPFWQIYQSNDSHFRDTDKGSLRENGRWMADRMSDKVAERWRIDG
jgi:hypothetical protein